MGVSPLKRRRAVFLDRDGVLNEAIVRDGKPYPPATVEELRLVAGVQPALQALKEEGFLLVVVTNQPDVARGTQDAQVLEDIHAWLRTQLPLDDILVCPHDDADDCDCRKPKPGLLQRAAHQHGVSLADSYMVGDRWRDVDAGTKAGCRTVWIDYGYRERGPSWPADARVKSVQAAVAWILKQEHRP